MTSSSANRASVGDSFCLALNEEGNIAYHKALGLSDADRERIAGELNGGEAAVGVLADFEAGPAISQRLTGLGGTTESYEVTDEALQAAASDTPEA